MIQPNDILHIDPAMRFIKVNRNGRFYEIPFTDEQWAQLLETMAKFAEDNIKNDFVITNEQL